MKDRIRHTFAFQELGSRKVEADFKGGNVSADGGILLFRKVDLRTGLVDRVAARFTDHRCQALIEHLIPELLRRRILSMAKNAVPLRHLDTTMFRAKPDACLRGGWCTYFREL